MLENGFLENLSPEEKRRIAYIEGREDLFKTKLFEVEKDNKTEGIPKEGENNIVVVSRDPGSANALFPVVELLNKDESSEIKIVADGRAEEIFEGKFKTKDITPQDSVFQIAEIVGSPDVILTDASTEQGAEIFIATTFNEVPVVLVEDYYDSSRGYLKRLKESNLPFPRKICVIDNEAKNLIIKKYPELANIIEVTGQPAFDRFAHEDTEKIAEEVRKKLGIKPEEKLIIFMSSMDKLELTQKIAEELTKVGGGFKFSFRIHPNDNVPLADHEKEFKDRNIDYVETLGFSTDEISAASDLVITTTSTEGLHAIYRRKPSIHINDPRFVDQSNLDMIPLPPVKLGASIGVDNVDDLAIWVNKLLDTQSEENAVLLKNMDKNYPSDGKNAQRVADILNSVLAGN